jgi:hypothetical protein
MESGHAVRRDRARHARGRQSRSYSITARAPRPPKRRDEKLAGGRGSGGVRGIGRWCSAWCRDAGDAARGGRGRTARWKSEDSVLVRASRRTSGTLIFVVGVAGRWAGASCAGMPAAGGSGSAAG